MNKHSYRILRSTAFAAVSSALGGVSLVTVAGCWDANPCDPGQILIQNQCHAAPVDPATTAATSSGSSGGTGAGGMTGGQPAADMYSYKTCATDADCGGQTPTCTKQAPPPSTTLYCTTSPCETGAADICPVGGSCTDKFKSFGAPNFCAKN